MTVVTLLLTAFGTADPARVTTTVASASAGLAPSTPVPQVVAQVGELRIDLPVAQRRLTALGYYGAGAGALALEPLGRQGNRGRLGRLLDRVLGHDGDGLTWYRLRGGQGTATSALAVGAAPGADVFSPVDGTIVGITDYVVDGRKHGVRVDIQPAAAPSLVVSVSRLAGRPGAHGRLRGRRRHAPSRTSRRPGEGRADGTGGAHAGRREPRDPRGPARRDPVAQLKILFVGDVFGAPGRRAVEERLPGLRDELAIDFCIVNGENAADGRGITPKLADKILAAGADVITLGNHTWARRELAPYLTGSERVIRPANFARAAPGRGVAVAPARDGTHVAVLNLMGTLFLDVPHSPWEIVDELVEEARRQAPVVIVDMHGEATSEKVAMASWLDGRVTAVIGTHTHVQTNDARILPGGTAALSDAGMTGPHDSVIGVQTELILQRLRTGMPVRFEPATGDVRIEGVLLECDPARPGRAASLQARPRRGVM